MDLDAAYEFRRQQRVTDAAPDAGTGLVQHEPVAVGDAVAVQQGLGQAGVGTTQSDAVAFIESARAAGRAVQDGDAGHASQRVSHVLVRHFADVFGRDNVDVGVGIAFDAQRFFLSGADAGHDDRLKLLLGRCRRLLRRGGATDTEQGDENRLRDGGLLDLHVLFLVVAMETGWAGGGGFRWIAYHLQSCCCSGCPRYRCAASAMPL
mmetsp:Transcript_22306/g.87935  ORF Transcript_22306/g.87935 Transcript_22306/m.87935 type:complete len:207 (+) Transcript_22306:4256-4876(+)